MAHSCWGPNEIITAIAAILLKDKATASAVSLARCSRSLEQPVLCEVWRSLDSLAPLVKCFPSEVWDIKRTKGVLFFKRAPIRIEWTRFQQRYASKVRQLDVSNLDAVISLAALQLLQLYSHAYGSPLLPNLMSLVWNSHDNEIPFITSFFSSSLTSITIDVPASATLILPPILMKLSAMSPNISRIVVEQLHLEPSMEEASSQLLMQCNPHRLRTYDVDAPLSASALSHVMQLPSLEKICLVGPFHFPDPLPDILFPSLRELGIKSPGDLAWLKLLPKCPVLSVIYVQCPGSDFAQYTETLHSTITGCGMHDRLQELKLWSADEFKITPQILGNFSFKNLTSFRLHSSSSESIPCQTLDLTDADIGLLTNAMPGLITLVIGEKPCSEPSKITFNSLYTISRRCIRLKKLRIHFNPDSFINKVDHSKNDGFETPLSDVCSVTKIDVGNIRLTRRNVYIMALGLLEVFPRLEGIKHEYYPWEEVDELIKSHRHIRSAARQLTCV